MVRGGTPPRGFLWRDERRHPRPALVGEGGCSGEEGRRHLAAERLRIRAAAALPVAALRDRLRGAPPIRPAETLPALLGMIARSVDQASEFGHSQRDTLGRNALFCRPSTSDLLRATSKAACASSASEAESYLDVVAKEIRWEGQDVSVVTPEGVDVAST